MGFPKGLYSWLLAFSLFSICQSVKPEETAELDDKPPFRILQLGDSYSAGNGAWDSRGQRRYHPIEGCYRSKYNWGSQFAQSLEDRYSVQYVNHACSGGKIEHLTDDRKVRTVSRWPWQSCSSFKKYDEEYYKSSGRVQCSHWVFPQLNYVDESYDLVLMTFAGNDAGFTHIVTNCFVTGYRSVRRCRESINNATRRMEDAIQRLPEALRKISERMNPCAKIAYNVYPHIIFDFGYILRDTIGNDSIEAGDMIRQLSNQADEALTDVVRAFNEEMGREVVYFYDDTKTVFEGREPKPGITGNNPDRWILAILDSSPLWTAEWYHPNTRGHEEWALGLIDDLGPVDVCDRVQVDNPCIAWIDDDTVVSIVGEPFVLDAQGSWAEEGDPIVSYRWMLDYDGDGIFEIDQEVDTVTFEITIDEEIDEEVDAFVTLIVTTKDGDTASTTVPLIVNAEGTVQQVDPEIECELDDLGRPIFIDEDAIPLNCYFDPALFPSSDLPGVEVSSDETGKKGKKAAKKAKGTKASKKGKGKGH
mmetsp:Transcript_12705/g.35228  ORF Transcript_12705/g.35228 Transcript_12705/m.35228 type:complete len:532 (+) Transcript_12705:196-1791(+)